MSLTPILDLYCEHFFAVRDSKKRFIGRMSTDERDVTVILRELSDGETGASDRLFAMVYDNLRRQAQGQLRRERKDHTLNATALVHEAYLKLIDQREVTWQNRAHFFAIAAQAMRRILINYAKARKADKRGGGEAAVTLNEEIMPGIARGDELLDLDRALEKLAELNERQARVVECKFFGGLNHEEIAEVLKVSVPTVTRDWRFARAWLSRELRSEE